VQAASWMCSGLCVWFGVVASEAMAKKYREMRSVLEVIVVAGKDNDTVPVGLLRSIRSASGLEHLR